MEDWEKILKWQNLMGADEVVDKSNTGLVNFKDNASQNNNKQEISQSIMPNKEGKYSHNEILAYAESLAQNCHDLESLHNAIKNFSHCELIHNAINTVLCNKYERSDLMLIGEAPGASEDKHGVPFCGDSGKLLEKMFEAIGYKRDELFITNSVFWRPPGNRRPTNQEIEMCRPFVYRVIELVKPKIIILVGATAVTSILNKDEPMNWLRRKIIQQKIGNIKQDLHITAIYHPAYLLRQPAQKKTAWFDLLFIKKFINNY